MKRIAIIVAAALTCCALSSPALAYAEEPSIYAPFKSFSELYDAYLVAIEEGDEIKMAWLEGIGRSSLDAEIEAAEVKEGGAGSSLIMPRGVAVSNYFEYAEFRGSSVQTANLALMPKGSYKTYWSDADKLNGWNAVYWDFRNDYRWANMSVMKDQFYCHARLVYSFAAGEWNLEPWRTSMNPITCN